jgi:hypothetical protein
MRPERLKNDLEVYYTINWWIIYEILEVVSNGCWDWLRLFSKIVNYQW